MRRTLSIVRSTPAIAIAVIVLLAALGGYAIAASSRSPVIRACANKRNGALRVARKCRHHERRLSWNQVGPTGPRGPRGANGRGLRGFTGAPGPAGAAGAQGKEGPQGPGAISFDTPVAEKAVLAGPVNGIEVRAVCKPEAKEVFVEVAVASNQNTLQASGTGADGAALVAVDSSGAGAGIVKRGPETADLDVVAADSTIGKTVRVGVDVHGQFAEPECRAWGMAIPAA